MARGLIGTINDEIASGGSITGDLTVEGDLTIQGSSTSSNYDEVIDGHVQVTSTNKLKFGGSTSTDSDTYIYESAADSLDLYAGGVQMLQLLEAGTDYIWSPVDATIFAMGVGKDLQISISSDNVVISNATSDKDILIKGNDGGATITALTFDMSAAGNASFNADVTVGALLKMSSNTSAKILIADGTSYEEQAVSGDATISNSGVVAISSDVIVNADVKSDAAIVMSKTAFVAGTNCTLSTNTLAVDDAFLINDGNDTTTGVITSAGYKLTKSDGGGDVTIEFQQAGTTTYTMGIDDAVSSGTADLFKIHSDTALVDASDFIMDKSGNVTIGGDLTVTGDDLYMNTNTSGAALIADGTNFNPVVISGDIAIATNGVAAIGSEVIVNADVHASAGIVDTKLATISTAGKVDIGALEIDGATDIGAGLADADLIIVDDNAAGAEKKCAMSRVKTYVADVTLTTGTQAALTTLAGLTTIGASTPTTTNVAGILTVGTSGAGQNVTFYSGASSSVGMVWDEDGGTGTANGALTLGANDHGVDFTVYGDADGDKMVWDSSGNSLTITGTLQTADLVLNNDRGHYTIVEEEDYLSIKNEKNGKMYKFVLEEIDAND